MADNQATDGHVNPDRANAEQLASEGRALTISKVCAAISVISACVSASVFFGTFAPEELIQGRQSDDP